MSSNGRLKPSRYNYFVDLPSGGQLAFNAATAALAEIDQETLPRFNRLLESQGLPSSEADSELLEQMKYARFLCPESHDEVSEQRDRDRLQRQSQSTFFLTIAPTLACNFRCDYCFQHSSPAVMNSEVIDALTGFCEQYLLGSERFMITWFGGEPTLCLETIAELQGRIAGLSERYGVKELTASVITNGYLLDGKMAQRFKEIGIGEAQITLDGPREVHDRRRQLSGGRGTFDRIMDNLEESSPILRVIVRINVDTDNSSAPLEVIELLERRGLLPHVNIYFAPVNPAKGVCADVSGRCLSTEAFAHLQVKLYRELVTRGIRRIEYPLVAPGGYCGAGNDHSFVVAPNGLLFKCWEELSLDPAEAIGDIFGTTPSEQQQRNHDRYRKSDPLSKSGCRECGILPLCLGGCPNAAANGADENRGFCSPWKFNLGEMLTLRYLCNTHEEVTG